MILIMFKKIASSEIPNIHKLFRNIPKNTPVNKIKNTNLPNDKPAGKLASQKLIYLAHSIIHM